MLKRNLQMPCRNYSEKKIETGVSKYAKSLGWSYHKYRPVNDKGFPDRFFLRDGKIIFVEFKAPGEAPNPLQWSRIMDLDLSGFDVYVIDNENLGKRIFNSYEKKKRIKKGAKARLSMG